MSRLNPSSWFRRPARPGQAPATLPGHESAHANPGGRGIPWVAVQSSNLDRVAYYPAARVLLVQFRHGGCYRYEGVPGAVWNSLASGGGGSVGVYHAYYVKWAYPYRGPMREDDPELTRGL